MTPRHPGPARVALGERLREIRRHRGLSQAEVAQAVGIPRSAMSDIERGRRGVDALELGTLAALYWCSVDHLLGELAPDPHLDRLGAAHTATCPLWDTPDPDDTTCTCPTVLSDAPVMADALRWLLGGGS
jgi:transcriptional regulator with XRE-family HTH domain